MDTVRDFRFCDTPAMLSYKAYEQEIGRNRDNPYWGINNSPVLTYGGEDYSAEFIRLLSERKPGVALEIAAGDQAVALQDLLCTGLATNALANNLVDHRTPETRARTNLDQIIGDITLSSTWRRIDSWRHKHAPEGFSAILYRPAGALSGMPVEFYESAAGVLADWLIPDGLAFLQLQRNTQRYTGQLCSRVDLDVRIVNSNGAFYDEMALISKR